MAAIEGLIFNDLKLGSDPRGVAREYFRRSSSAELGFACPDRGWAQINVTESNHGAIRDLHGEDMDKLLGVVSGEAFGAWVDSRPDSASFGEVVTSMLTPCHQVFVPTEVLNGFQSVSNLSQYLYCFSTEWTADMHGVRVNPLDPTLAIPCSVAIKESNQAQVSEDDSGADSWRMVVMKIRGVES